MITTSTDAILEPSGRSRGVCRFCPRSDFRPDGRRARLPSALEGRVEDLFQTVPEHGESEDDERDEDPRWREVEPKPPEQREVRVRLVGDLAPALDRPGTFPSEPEERQEGLG